MLNLPTTFPLSADRPLKANELPVLVDLNWFGRVMTSPNAGIVRFANANRPVTPQSSDDGSLIL